MAVLFPIFPFLITKCVSLCPVLVLRVSLRCSLCRAAVLSIVRSHIIVSHLLVPVDRTCILEYILPGCVVTHGTISGLGAGDVPNRNVLMNVMSF